MNVQSLNLLIKYCRSRCLYSYCSSLSMRLQSGVSYWDAHGWRRSDASSAWHKCWWWSVTCITSTRVSSWILIIMVLIGLHLNMAQGRREKISMGARAFQRYMSCLYRVVMYCWKLLNPTFKCVPLLHFPVIPVRLILEFYVIFYTY